MTQAPIPAGGAVEAKPGQPPIAYYNENNPYAAEWLCNLMAAGLITPGHVDTRSIVDVRPSDLEGFDRCHFFAGIGVWDYALRLAKWPAGRPVWTGSCPCQPFSKAGRGLGIADERHLWPAWFGLIRECRPHTILGEQVPVAAARGWLDLVCANLEGEHYAVGAVAAEAAALGEPIARDRIWFAAQHLGPRVAGQFECGPARPARPRRWRGEADLRAVADAPFEPGDRWPAPLVRRVDHGFAGTVGGMSAYGNAINAEAAAAFISAALDALTDPAADPAARALPLTSPEDRT